LWRSSRHLHLRRDVQGGLRVSAAIGKEPVEVKDGPGFIVNKILIPMINEAVCVLQDGIASAADIDKAMQLGANFPWDRWRLTT
jgi:3-hydroxyacyl-CoA dehydrogenase